MAKPKEDVEDIIKRAVEAGRISAERTARDAFKATEKRLYALPILRLKATEDRERLQELREYGPRGKSKSIVRFQKQGVRLSPDEILGTILLDMEATIAADEYEVEILERALSRVAHDAYYPTITGRYVDDLTDEQVAAAIPCDTSTVWRNRKRLVQRIAVWLYGADAVREP
ncbi:MAG: hypothetical protein RR949_04570, partial [Oscillospiraceae bacterium]